MKLLTDKEFIKRKLYSIDYNLDNYFRINYNEVRDTILESDNIEAYSCKIVDSISDKGREDVLYIFKHGVNLIVYIEGSEYLNFYHNPNDIEIDWMIEILSKFNIDIEFFNNFRRKVRGL